jgi:NTP pyrophosphatase (non-canonical NTP hydrolase)
MKRPVLIHLAEECSELAMAILKAHRGDGPMSNVLDEMADVQALLDRFTSQIPVKRLESKRKKMERKYAKV